MNRAASGAAFLAAAGFVAIAACIPSAVRPGASLETTTLHARPEATPVHETINFFSWTTRVSLELPVGFEEMREDPAASQVIYEDQREDSDVPAAVVLIRTVQVPPGTSGVLLRASDELQAVPGRREQRRTEGRIDGMPAVFLHARVDPPELGRTLARHEAIVQRGDVVVIMSGSCAESDQAEYLPAFEEAFRSARLILEPQNAAAPAGAWQSRHDEDLLVSLRAPSEWTMERRGGSLRLQRPEGGGITLSRGAPTEYTRAWLERHADEAAEAWGATRSGFEAVTGEPMTLSSLGTQVSVRRLRWTEAGGGAGEGVLAFILESPFVVYRFEAEGLPENEAAQVLRTIRFLSPK